MVWINHEHHNVIPPKGVFGGSMCVCPECCASREKERKPVSPWPDDIVSMEVCKKCFRSKCFCTCEDKE